MKTFRPKVLWAPIVSTHTDKEWVFHHAIRSTRKSAREAYISSFSPHYISTALKRVRFVRVKVEELTPDEFSKAKKSVHTTKGST